MLHFRATDTPTLVHVHCDRCGKAYALHLPLSATVLLGTIGSLLGEHTDCEQVKPEDIKRGLSEGSDT